MMGRMAPRTARHRLGAVLCSAAAGLALALAACTPEPPPDQPPDGEPAALELEVVENPHGACDDESESAVGDLLTSYVVTGFLGDYPRDDFGGAFDLFTSGAVGRAGPDIDLLTASRYEQASEVTATRLRARVSCLVDGLNVYGATAHVDLAFEAVVAGRTTAFGLRGRLMLVHQNRGWSVFGYDVDRFDAAEERP